jgi:aminoglycoside 2'-N-acetyltransferase I
MDRAQVRIIDSQQLPAATCRSTRRLLDAAFGGEFSEDDWQHALGGWHVVAGPDDDVNGHAAVVERRIVVGARQLRAGYVEAVAVWPARQRRGIGTVVMQAVGDIIRDRFDLGVLSTGAWAFYERLGWERWRGPTYVRRAATGEALRTPEEDDGVMMLRGVTGGDAIDLGAPIMCDERAGDSW